MSMVNEASGLLEARVVNDRRVKEIFDAFQLYNLGIAGIILDDDDPELKAVWDVLESTR